MTAATMATAAGAAVLLYFMTSRIFMAASSREGEEDFSKSGRSGRRKIVRRPAQAPATWFEAISTFSETLRFTYSETLGKWPIGDLAFGINFLMRRQGNQQVASVYAGSGCLELKRPELVAELIHLLRLLTLCMYFSKRPFPVFLEFAGFSQEDVLLEKPKAGLLKPAFTILADRSTNCFLLLIRGTHSIKDTLTAATGAVVPFHHSVLHGGGVSNLVLGYAHCGMVAAACWIAKLSTPCLLKAVSEYPDYKIKIVGHSLGGGTAALLTYILRERKEFSSSTCVAFAPAACMTWDLAESGKHFITTVINGSDLVPTFSTASVDDLRTEVTASSWLNDLRDQIEHTRFLNFLFRPAFAFGSRLPSMASARARVAGASAFLRPVSSSTQVVMRRAQNVAQAVVRTRSSLSSWSCMGARRRTVSTMPKAEEESTPNLSMKSIKSSETIMSEMADGDSEMELEFGRSKHADCREEFEEEGEVLIPVDRVIDTSRDEEMSKGDLWYELEKELHRNAEAHVQAREEEEAAVIEITEEENSVLADAAENKIPKTSEAYETHRFYPPGRIMHIVALPPADTDLGEDRTTGEEKVGIYETPRNLYGKIRLSRTMINDHYMPMYKKMMELLISELEKDAEVGRSIL